MKCLITICLFLFMATACGNAPTTDLASTTEKDMQFVPGAAFRMGTDQEELDKIKAATGLPTTELLMAEAPSRKVTVQDFYIDIYDVTNRQYADFIKAMPNWSKVGVDSALHNGRYLEHWVNGEPPKQLLDHPVTFVTWQAAAAYCKWRGKRLPTEIEFEWAAQDGVNPIEYPWGNSPPRDELVNWGGNGIKTTVKVGSYPPNARGLYDMAGNVWHFTSDPWLGSYADMLAGSGNAK